jgi:hypothetical protein
MVLTSDFFSGIEEMTDQDLDHADQQCNLIQATALFLHKQFVTLNTAAKAAYINAPTSNGPHDFTSARSTI